jgi:hypothetical protein
VLPAAPCAEPVVWPEQPLDPTPCGRLELPDDPGPVPGVVPMVDGALVLEPLVPIGSEPILFGVVSVDIPDGPVPKVPAEPAPAPPAPPPALCAKAAPHTKEKAAADANKIRLIPRPPEMMSRVRAISSRRLPGEPSPETASSDSSQRSRKRERPPRQARPTGTEIPFDNGFAAKHGYATRGREPAGEMVSGKLGGRRC